MQLALVELVGLYLSLRGGGKETEGRGRGKRRKRRGGKKKEKEEGKGLQTLRIGWREKLNDVKSQ